MIVVTGAAGFIGSNLAAGLNRARYRDLVLVDDFSRAEKRRNYEGKQFSLKVDRKELQGWIRENHRFIQMVLHMGARTDTAEFSWDVFRELNVDYSRELFSLCIEFGLPVIYASSAATYGLGEHGYHDSHDLVPRLSPLNPYGRSKQEFDLWVLSLERQPFFWAGLKFFNVYGPNEYHKGRMASVVYHAFSQVRETGRVKLFRSHNPRFGDGEQARDFIHVKDVVDVILWLMEQRPASGLYNVGTGHASTFLELVHATFHAMGKNPEIEFMDTPEDIRDKYQYFTEARMEKLRDAGYTAPFTPLEDGIRDYVTGFLLPGRIL
ncbi:MAG: ADP-glyceromanno-heptose 6-epimerase [Bacteroidetes bacterium]|nr:MAG: ADP-glyceromanno-heptose 6-epimerase [Bacteroidota bacterium]